MYPAVWTIITNTLFSIRGDVHSEGGLLCATYRGGYRGKIDQGGPYLNFFASISSAKKYVFITMPINPQNQ